MTPSPHDCAWAEAVLTGESPPLLGDPAGFEAGVAACPDCAALAAALHDIDALATTLPELTVPHELSRRTLHAVLDELDPGSRAQRRAPRQRWPSLVLVGGLSIAAAALLAVWPQGPAPAPPERLVARGSATAMPTVSLKVAVDDGHGLERHRRDQRYPTGTQVRFRVGLDRPADVALVRVSPKGRQVLTRSSLSSGDHDLTLDGSPLAWEVEPGEDDARFVLLAAPSGRLPADPSAAVATGSGALESTDLCDHVTAFACDERLLQVSP